MTGVPKRTSLVEQAADILRESLHQGEWVGFLPGENTLTKRLKVSRPTLRAALEMLQREGLLQASQGRRRRILGGTRRPQRKNASKEIGIITGLPFHALSSFSLFVISELQDDLGNDGYKVTIHSQAQFGSLHPERALENLLTQTQIGCWLLMGPTPACAEWFARRQVPAISQGLTPQGTVPSLDIDVRSTARHAVGVCHRKGHSRPALLMPDVGGEEIEEGFRQGIASLSLRDGRETMVLRKSDSLPAIRSALTTVFTSPARPTVLVVARPKHVLTTMSHLYGAGFRIPQDVSIVSLGHYPYLNDMVPSVAHYAFDWKLLAKNQCRLVRTMIQRGPLPPHRHLVMTQFKDGGTFGFASLLKRATTCDCVPFA